MPVTNRFLLSLFPENVKLFPPYNTDEDGWIVGSDAQRQNADFDTQLVQCAYSPSGSYGPTPRYAFYALLVVTIVWRQVGWAAKVALGAVMVYSATTTIHAVILPSIHTRLMLGIDPEAKDYEIVRVGDSLFPAKHSPGDDSLWMAVLPMAWDSDVDPVLTVVGLAFLVLLPMQIWSLTLRESLRESSVKLLLSLWVVFLFAGALCALVAEAYVQLWAFPQLRFCPRGFHDALPLMNDGSQTVGGTWDGQDWYHWSRTVLAHFVNKTDTRPLGNTCIYPCFDTAWPLRDPTEIQVLPLIISALVAMYFLFGATSVANLSIAVIMNKPGRRLFAMMRLDYFSEFLSDENAHRLVVSQARYPWTKALIMFRHILARFQSPRPGSSALGKRSLVLCLQGYFLIIYVYAWLSGLPVCLYFTVFMGYVIWASDPPSESFNHIGQWGTIAGLVLTFGAAGLGLVMENIGRRRQKSIRALSNSTRLILRRFASICSLGSHA
ncbi:hypothetical protein BM221_001031 [Beauveria bassiana]|uniref:Uncharacterized protein n=1 Tax=Beauveria bassiana TaxID=176275 RepID=A0A2N6P256_BEABA|nr:hypothetical protein BM221_001031 [Beauveria bassiana]